MFGKIRICIKICNQWFLFHNACALCCQFRFIMNVKLFTVMGISWIAEIISSLLNKYTTDEQFQYKEELFYLPDTINCLQGVFIFVLFVVKRRVHEALRKRFGHGSKKQYGISQANSTLQDPYKVKKSASNSTLTSSFAVSSTPWSKRGKF